MTIATGFAPIAGRAQAMNARMYGQLGDSLRHIAQCVGSDLVYDREGYGSWCDGLAMGVAPDPGLFASYYRLVFALDDENFQLAQTLLEQIATSAPQPDNEIRVMGDDLGTDRSTLYAHMIEEDEPLKFAVEPPTDANVSAFMTVYPAARELITSAAPELAEEVTGLARQIILIGQGVSHEAVFDGGSHFQLWNALFINVDRPRSRVALAEVIAHESAHSLLFGFCTDEPLTLNAGEELYSSPLRSDQRPMDGIYHATFVSARMYWLMARLLETDLLEESERAEASEAMARDRENFEEGYAVVARHGKLSSTGSCVMSGARAYMDATRIAEPPIVAEASR